MSALLPAAKLKLGQFGDRYCQGGCNKYDKYAGVQLRIHFYVSYNFRSIYTNAHSLLLQV